MSPLLTISSVSFALICFSLLAQATQFKDHPYYSYSGPLDFAVGKISCLDVCSTGASCEATAVHIGNGFILASSHTHLESCSSGSIVFTLLRGSNQNVQIPLILLGSCNHAVDSCLLSIDDPDFIPSTKVDLSLQPPPQFRDILSVGFPQNSTFEVTASRGQIVGDEFQIQTQAEPPTVQVFPHTARFTRNS